MNKPIDPNLNDSFDIGLDLTPDTKPTEAELIQPKLTIEKSESTNSDEGAMQLTEKTVRRHHHSSGSSHHSSGEHSHHSSSSHSSGSSHHSSSSHNSHSSHSHSSNNKKKKKKIPVSAKIAIAFLVIILLLIAIVVGTIFFLEARGKNDLASSNITNQNNYEEVIEYNGHKYVYNDDVISIAFMGIDKRELDTDAQIGTAGQADADLILTVDSNTGRSKVIAIPRDTMVDVDIYSESGIFLRNENMQLCLSYAYGDGGESSAHNVTTSVSRVLYNVPINKYFALDLDGIAPINDALGGVTVESMFDFPDLGITKGDQVHLIGDLTEVYVRRRDMDTVDASLNRTARQVQYIKAFASQALPAVINDFGVVSRLYNTASGYSATDLDVSNVTYLASLLLSKGVRDFETTTLQGEMKMSDKADATGRVYAEFYPDETATLETVLDTFYTRVD